MGKLNQGNTLKIGTRVLVLNTTLAGEQICEGAGVLLSKCGYGHCEPYERWRVRFDDDGEVHPRNVSPGNIILSEYP